MSIVFDLGFSSFDAVTTSAHLHSKIKREMRQGRLIIMSVLFYRLAPKVVELVKSKKDEMYGVSDKMCICIQPVTTCIIVCYI